MMILKAILFFIFSLSALSADVYYAKAEPFRRHLVKSNVSGKVIFADEGIEGSMATHKPLILIDADIDKQEYSRLKSQIETLDNSILNHQAVYKKHFHYYESIKNLASKSQSSKDAAFYAQAGAKQSLNAAMIELDNSKQRLFVLGRQIRDKEIAFPKWYVYDLHVTEDDYVTLGSPLLTVADVSQIKLTLFLSASDAQNIDKMQIFINDKKSDLKMDQVWRMSDTKHLSSYEARLIIPAMSQLSQLVKVELKGKEL